MSGSDAAIEGKWLQTDGPTAGQQIPFLPWAYGEPNGGVGQNCLAFGLFEGLSDVDCNSSAMDYIIEFDRKRRGSHENAA